MGYRDILVHVDQRPQAAAREECAIRLAGRCGARVSGLFVHPQTRLPRHILNELGSAAAHSHRLAREQLEAAAEKAFRERAAHAGVDADWRSGEGHVADVLIRRARYADLLVVGQVAEDEEDAEEDENFDPELPDRVAMSAGLPVLVVPTDLRTDSIGERVLVAWNASREASRAVRDAMPLLRGAAKVTVMAAKCRGDRPTGEKEPGADITRHLVDHGVPAETLALEAGDRDAGSLLLETAGKVGADLIVMGAYGRPRWREFILGGATRHLLDGATMPVLMSH